MDIVKEQLFEENSKLKKENRELRKFLREIKNIPLSGDFDCGLADEICPVDNCHKCLATFALKNNRPKFSKWRKV